MTTKRKPKKRRAPPARAPKKRARKKPTAARKRAPPKRSKRARSETTKRGWATRRKRAKQLIRERDADLGDVEIESADPDAWLPDEDYRAYPLTPRDLDGWRKVDPHAGAMRWLESRFGLPVESEREIVWFPTFDEVYDYIDALVEAYDLDAHQMFELAYGYADEVA